RKRIVLTIRNAGTSTIASAGNAASRSCNPYGYKYTVAAITDAAAGLGIPTKYRLSVDAMLVAVWTLKRARRIAAALTYRNPAAHPRRSSGQSPHVNARIAGPRPNDTTSASESSSTPN